MRIKSRNINSVEIARIAGVSRSTVSRVINNYSNVPHDTRNKVMKVIQEYNYHPNVYARQLAGTKTRTIGLFIIDKESVSENHYYNMLLASVIEEASALGYHVLTYILKNMQNTENVNSIKEVFFQQRADAGIFIGAKNHEPVIEELIAEGFYVGIIDHELPDTTEANRLVCNVDNETSMEKVVDYLVGLGHREIGVILGNLKTFSGAARYQGLLKGMKKHGLVIPDAWMLVAQFKENISYDAMKEMLQKSGRLPTAIIAANDNIAIGAIKAIQDFGLKVPDDISVIGFDDLLTSAYFKPALTTVRVDYVAMGKFLASNLIKLLEKGGHTELIRMKMGTVIIERESCRMLE